MSKFTTREYKNIAKRPSPRQVRKDPEYPELNVADEAEKNMTNLGEQEFKAAGENIEDEVIIYKVLDSENGVDPREGNGVVTEVNPPGSVNGENPPLNYGSIDK